MPIENEKKKFKTPEFVESDESDQEEVSEEEEEEAYETEESDNDNTDDDEVDDAGAESDSTWNTDKNEKEEDAKRKASLLKRKKKAVEHKNVKKIKKNPEELKIKKNKKKIAKPEEKKAEENSITGEKKKQNELPDFSDKNVDVDLYHEDTQRVIQKRIKITDNIIVSCKMISVNQRQANGFEYAGLVFARKGRADKAFEYNLPLNLTPKIIAALNIIVTENPKFFQKNS